MNTLTQETYRTDTDLGVEAQANSPANDEPAPSNPPPVEDASSANSAPPGNGVCPSDAAGILSPDPWEETCDFPVAPVEVVTERSDHGKEAAWLARHARGNAEFFDGKSDCFPGYGQSVERAIQRVCGIVSRDDPGGLLSSIVGERVSISDVQTDAFGTWKGDASRNIRIPMGAIRNDDDTTILLADVQRRGLLSLVGKGLRQEAMAANKVEVVEQDEANTYSVFVRTAEDICATVVEEVVALLNESGDGTYEVSVSQVTQGHIYDLISLGEALDAPDLVHEAFATALVDHSIPGDDIIVRHASMETDFFGTSDYDAHIQALKDYVLQEEAEKAADQYGGEAADYAAALQGAPRTSGAPPENGSAGASGVRAAWNSYRDRVECIDEAGRQLEAIGRDLDEALGELIDAVRLASPDSSLARDGIVQALEEYEDGGTDQEPGTDTSPGDNPHETRRVEDDGIQHLQIREIPDDGLPLGVN